MAGGHDSLIRLGGQQVQKEVFLKVADGPLRAIFRMEYTFIVDERPLQITEDVSISAGQYYYRSKVTIRNAPAGARLVTGIAAFYSNEPGNFGKEQANVLYSYGRQSENKDLLGMAILVDKKDFAAFRSLPATGGEVNSSYTVSQFIKDKPLYFRFYTCWEKTDPRYASKAYFSAFLQREAEKFSHPVQWK